MERNPSQCKIILLVHIIYFIIHFFFSLVESGYLKSKCNLQLLDKIEIFDNKYKNKNEKVIQNLGLFFV